MRKFTLAISIATASLMVSGCQNTSVAPKDEATTVEASEAVTPVADVNSADAKMVSSGEANSAVVDDDKGGDPGARK